MRFPEFHLGRSLLLVTVVVLAAWGCQAPDLFYRQDGSLISGAGGFEEPGVGGSIEGTGGKVVGAGGMRVGTGGMAMGTGGRRGTGGMMAADAGMDASMDATMPGTGGRAPGTGGATGTNPCAGLCDTPIVFLGQNYNSGNLPLTATCHETTSSLAGIGLSNFAAGGRSMKINNGTAITMDSQFAPPPTKRNGGYCFQTSTGTVTYSAFYTF